MTLQEVQIEIDLTLQRLEKLFKPGSQLTFLMRRPDKPDGSQNLILTKDDLAGVETAVRQFRQKDEAGLKMMRYMTEPELSEHLNQQLRFIKASQTTDTIGSILVLFQDDGITQYGATVDPETVPQALRELADRLEQRQTVKR